MEYKVGDILTIRNEKYKVAGKILYRNTNDNCDWFEYKIITGAGQELWLSCDDVYHEYSISQVCAGGPPQDYNLVDQGTERVIRAQGNVDVDPGEQAYFYEYEDESTDNIASVEEWSDGREYSKGYYIEVEDIICDNSSAAKNAFSQGAGRRSGNQTNGYNQNIYQSGQKYKLHKSPKLIVAVFIIFFLIISVGSKVIGAQKSMKKYLAHNSSFTYVTSITGENKQKADVYKSSFDKDQTAKCLINAMEGNITGVNQNTEDGDDSIAVLTKDEYALVYTTENNEIYVQVSSRKYAYSSDKGMYHANDSTYRYYRRYYYSKGFNTDSTSYRNWSSSYSDYDGSTVNTSDSDTYSNYASSVRQASVNARKSSGGGLSSGK